MRGLRRRARGSFGCGGGREATAWSVDGCYALYWWWRDPAALELMREANAPASLSLFWVCGLLWYYDGPLATMWADARRVLRMPTS